MHNAFNQTFTWWKLHAASDYAVAFLLTSCIQGCCLTAARVCSILACGKSHDAPNLYVTVIKACPLPVKVCLVQRSLGQITLDMHSLPNMHELFRSLKALRPLLLMK